MPHTRGRSTSFLDTIRNAQTSSGDFKENVRQRNKTQRHSGLAHSLSRPALGATDSEPVLRGRRSNLGFAKSTHLSPCRPLDVPSSLRKSVSRSRSPFAPQERFPTPSHASSRQSSASRTGSVLVETELYDATFAEDFASLEIEPTLFAPSTFSAELLSLGDIYIVALLEPSVDLHIPPSSAVIPNASPLFRMVHSPASGYGLVATEDIEVGTTLLVEHPVVIIPHDLEFLSQIKVEGIVKTNTIPIELKSQEDKDSNSIMYHGVFIKASRCNHRWDLQTFSLHLEAVQPINPGEQITVHYVPLEQPRSERRAQLQELYHFTCQCDHCNVPDKLALAGDDIRQQLLEFKERFPSFGNGALIWNSPTISSFVLTLGLWILSKRKDSKPWAEKDMLIVSPCVLVLSRTQNCSQSGSNMYGKYASKGVQSKSEHSIDGLKTRLRFLSGIGGTKSETVPRRNMRMGL
ncbi:SET domain-containing protein [Salix suchowensis]|nr:SET domain-containing protein [Salix suchowensis]